MTDMTENQELDQENEIQPEAVMPEVPVAQPLPEQPGLNMSNDRLELLLDIPLNISVELGRNKMSIQELLQLSPGAAIELDKSAGDPLDIMVNGRLVARGEAVVVNDKFGVRITDIVSPSERISRLR
jgi:flagellar motor switch protein FliN